MHPQKEELKAQEGGPAPETDAKNDPIDKKLLNIDDSIIKKEEQEESFDEEEEEDAESLKNMFSVEAEDIHQA